MIIIGEKLNGSIPSVAKAIADKDAELIKERARKRRQKRAPHFWTCVLLLRRTWK